MGSKSPFILTRTRHTNVDCPSTSSAPCRSPCYRSPRRRSNFRSLCRPIHRLSPVLFMQGNHQGFGPGFASGVRPTLTAKSAGVPHVHDNYYVLVTNLLRLCTTSPPVCVCSRTYRWSSLEAFLSTNYYRSTLLELCSVPALVILYAI